MAPEAVKQEASSSLQSRTKAERRNFCCFRSNRLGPLDVVPAALVSFQSVGLFHITDLPFSPGKVFTSYIIFTGLLWRVMS